LAGPPLGGLFTDVARLTWRFCFWINLPFGGIAATIFLLGFRSPVMKPSKLTFRQKLIEMDITGTVLFVSSMTCLFLALQWGGTNYAWSSSKVWGLILGSGLLFAAFITLQLHLGERATIPLRIFRNRSLSLSLLTSALLYFGLTVHTFYLPFYFQSAKGTSAASSGLRMLPYIVTFSVTQMAIGSAVTMLGVYLPFMWTGSAIFTIGAGLISSLKTTSDIGHPIGYQILAGYGFGSSMQLCATAVRASVSDRKDIPISSALTIFAPFFGGALAAAVAQNIFRVELVRALQHSAVAGNTTAIVAAGATGGQNVVPVMLKGVVREAYGFAVSKTFLLAVASGGLAFLCTLGIEWKNLKRAAKQDSTEGRGLNETKGVTISVQEKS
ncbi:Efflux pump, partial [Lachnellula willkommii]